MRGAATQMMEISCPTKDVPWAEFNCLHGENHRAAVRLKGNVLMVLHELSIKQITKRWSEKLREETERCGEVEEAKAR